MKIHLTPPVKVTHPLFTDLGHRFLSLKTLVFKPKLRPRRQRMIALKIVQGIGETQFKISRQFGPIIMNKQ